MSLNPRVFSFSPISPYNSVKKNLQNEGFKTGNKADPHNGDIRMSSEGGDSSISPADKTAAAISLESRDDMAKIVKPS